MKVLKEEMEFVLEEEEPAIPISENNKVKENVVEFQQQEQREEGDYALPSSESEDDMTIHQYFRSKGKQIDSSPVGDLETPLKTNERPLGMKRKFHCPDYDTDDEIQLNARISKRKLNMEMKENDYGNFRDTHFFPMVRAKEIQAKLDTKFPSFVKLMLRSHVSGGFWLHMPSGFCKINMPKDDQTIVLEDEIGQAYKVKYLANKMALSGGWRGFSILHNLLEHDVVVFHLVQLCKFKVYIVRASRSTEIDEDLGNSNRDANVEERDLGLNGEKNNTRCVSRDEKFYSSKVTNASDKSENGDDSLPKNVGIGFQGTFIQFQEFDIIVNGVCIDSMFTEEVRRNYYELCLARNSCLHELLKSDNSMLAAGIISETTIIANYIKGCKLSTSSDDFAMWDKTLQGFGVLGMDVGFLRSRLSYLVSMATEMRETREMKRYAEAKLERDYMEDHIHTLELRLRELKEAKRKLNNDIDVLKIQVERCELIFETEANTPWS